MGEIELVARSEAADGLSLHLRRVVSGYHVSFAHDTQHQHSEDRYHDHHDRSGGGLSSDWSIAHQVGIPRFVRFHPGRGGRL
jgi:hypothetical protein